MTDWFRAHARLCAVSFAALMLPSIAAAQSSPEALPELVITPLRMPEQPSRLGSAFTVVPQEEISAWGSKTLADALRQVPGLDITENGGAGGLSHVRLRGAESRQTLVLIDNVRVGDPGSTGGEMDMSNISPDDIERIEVLRGPQSALYGSDAMGGVINIITKKGAREQKSSLTFEGGSYGTLSTRLSTSGATERTSWAFSLSGFHSDGFSRYGYRIGRITSGLTIPLENDSTDRIAGSARVTHRFGETAEIDVGFRRSQIKANVDNPGAFIWPRDDTFDKTKQTLTNLYGKVSFDTFGGLMRNQVTLFSNWTDRTNRGLENCFEGWSVYACDVIFRSRRVGAEYQGDINFGAFGKTVIGARTEVEEALNREIWFPAFTNVPRFNGNQTTNSVFALHQATYGRWSVSLGGRVDVVDNTNVFPTWRATTAYNIDETGTKFRASAGTGAKAASLYQRFSIYGTPSLRPEHNFGFDVGVDQRLFNDRVKVSLTAFDTWYRDLFDFDFLGNGGNGAYINVGRARIKGLETSAEAIVVPDAWRVRAAYTNLRATDETTGLRLLRRPRDTASVAVIYTGLPNLEVEGRVTYVGERIDVLNDFPYSRVTMPSYGKFDSRVSYKVNEQLTLFARAENITNARYQQIRDYGTPGRSFFAGARVTW